MLNILNKNLIVAHYNENLDWLPNDIKIYVYSKAENPKVVRRNMVKKRLKDVGRESFTYLTHIVENFDNLAKVNIFSQGDPHPHVDNINDKIKQLNYDSFVPFGYGWQYYGKDWRTAWEDGGKALEYIWNWAGREGPIEFPLTVYNGSQFAVSNKNIMRRTKAEYQTLIDHHYQNNLMPWALEVFWFLIFGQ